MLVPVILVGGSGSRLAPISTPDCPKPFLDLAGHGQSLFQTTVLRATKASKTPPIVVGAIGHAELIQTQLQQIQVTASVILEPYKRNTAPAITAAALYAKEQYGKDATLLVLPADHYIQGLDYFIEAVNQAYIKSPKGQITVFGIKPTHANTNYGYIQHDKDGEFLTFVEKPNLKKAKSYLESNTYLWNSGFFLMPTQHYLTEIKHHERALYDAVKSAVDHRQDNSNQSLLSEEYSASPSISVDYAVLERSPNICLCSYNSGWSDLGTWSALHKLWPKVENVAANTAMNLTLRKQNDVMQLFQAEEWIADVE